MDLQLTCPPNIARPGVFNRPGRKISPAFFCTFNRKFLMCDCKRHLLFLLFLFTALLAKPLQASFLGVDRLEIKAHQALETIRLDPHVQLSTFQTDGCSGGMSFLYAKSGQLFYRIEKMFGKRPPWEMCCIIHDWFYHRAGGPAVDPEKSFHNRLIADQNLRSCVARTYQSSNQETQKSFQRKYHLRPTQLTKIYASVANAMYYAVRLGGGPCTGLSWRWGFGYPHCTFIGFKQK